MGLFYSITTLVFHYFSGYWINEQCRDPRFASHLISMNMRNSHSLWRRLLILGKSKMSDVVTEAAVVQIAGIVWSIIELTVVIINKLHPFDDYRSALMLLFYVEGAISLSFALYVSIRFDKKKRSLMNKQFDMETDDNI